MAVPPSATKCVAVVGANGALGKAVLAAFLAQNWQTFAADLKPVNPPDAATIGSTVLQLGMPVASMQQQLTEATGQHSFDVVVNAAGGWIGGPITDSRCGPASVHLMAQSLDTSMAAAHLFMMKCALNPLLVLPGAATALRPSPSTIAFGVTKAAVHHLVRSIGADESVKGTVIGVCPWVLNTLFNRNSMPMADRSGWTPVDFVADTIVEWALDTAKRPPTGTLVEFLTEKHKTKLRYY